MGNDFKKSRRRPIRKKLKSTIDVHEFNLYLVKQQLDLSKMIGSFSMAKTVEIKMKICKELTKLDGIETAKRSYTNCGVTNLNENVLAVLCSTCFSPIEQEELIKLLLDTNELITFDDLFCSFFEASSYKVIGLIADKCFQERISDQSKSYSITKSSMLHKYSILDVYLERFKHLHTILEFTYAKSPMENTHQKVCDYAQILYKLIRHGHKLRHLDHFIQQMHNLEIPTSYHSGVFHLFLFVNKSAIVETRHEVDLLTQLDNHLCELTLKRMQRIELEEQNIAETITISVWTRLFMYTECENLKHGQSQKEIESYLQSFKIRFYELLYMHIKKSPLSQHLTECNRELLKKLIVDNGGCFQPLSLSDFCRLKLVNTTRPSFSNNNNHQLSLPLCIKRFLNYEDEIIEHFPYFLLF